MKLCLIGSALALTVTLVRAQTVSAPRPQFEVASIKPLTADRDSRPQANCTAGGRFVSAGVPVKYLIEWAYDIRTEFSVPDWAEISGKRYDIEAKAEGPVSQAQCRLMTQLLLEDRFKLKFHRETKEMPVYALVVGKSGSKLHEAKPDSPPGDGVWLRGHKTSSKGWEPSMIASTLSSIPDVGRPVVDKTGLKGLFEFRLDYSVTPNEDRPNIFSALQDQLGLRLEPSKGPVEFVVIDQLEKPSEN
ncbi:MAG: TIGR03435 family protein [Bryobacteraceae bacterium]